MGFVGGGGLSSEENASLTNVPLTDAEEGIGQIYLAQQTGKTSPTFSNFKGDIFSTAAGYNGTIDTANTTATFNTNFYQNLILPYTISDLTEKITTNTNYVLVKTISTLNKKITSYTNQLKNDSASSSYPTYCYITFIYSDTTTANSVINSEYLTTYATKSYPNPNPSKTCSEIKVYLKVLTALNGYEKNDSMTATSEPSNLIVQTKTLTLDNTPNYFLITGKEATAGTGSVTADLSFDGGANYQTAINLREVQKITNKGSSFIGKLNLNGVGAGNTASMENWGIKFF